MQAEFSDTEIFVELDHIFHKFVDRLRMLQPHRQFTDPVADSLIEQLIRAVRIFVVTDDRSVPGTENLIKNADIKIKQLLKPDKIMFRHLIDAAVHMSHNLAGGRKRVLLIDQQIGQIIAPEISGKSIAVRHLHQPVQRIIKQIPVKYLVPGNRIVLHRLDHLREIFQNLVLIKGPIQNTFFDSCHFSSLSVPFPFSLSKKQDVL